MIHGVEDLEPPLFLECQYHLGFHGVTFSSWTDRRVLGRFIRAVDLNSHQVTLPGVTEQVDGFDWDKLDKYLKRFESGAIYKLLGFLVEKLAVPVLEAPRRLPAWRRQFTEEWLSWIHAGLTRGRSTVGGVSK